MGKDNTRSRSNAFSYSESEVPTVDDAKEIFMNLPIPLNFTIYTIAEDDSYEEYEEQSSYTIDNKQDFYYNQIDLSNC